MDITPNKLARSLMDPKERQRRYGVAMAKKIQLRLNALLAAECLHDFWPPYSGPERCHELKGDRAGTFSMDLQHPFRLLFVSANPTSGTISATEAPAEPGKEPWRMIRAIEIIGIEDTHD